MDIKYHFQNFCFYFILVPISVVPTLYSFYLVITRVPFYFRVGNRLYHLTICEYLAGVGADLIVRFISETLFLSYRLVTFLEGDIDLQDHPRWRLAQMMISMTD